MADRTETAIVWIHRLYDDRLTGPQPWPRRRRWRPDEQEWQAHCEGESVEQAEFASVEDALAWARERARTVIVALGGTEDTFYSAGEVRANEYVDGSGKDYLEWPPDNWPDYRGPDAERRTF